LFFHTFLSLSRCIPHNAEIHTPGRSYSASRTSDSDVDDAMVILNSDEEYDDDSGRW
jgi:hypothetical protein